MTLKTKRPAFEQFAAARNYQGGLTFSPDGSQLAYSTNTSGNFNIWRQASDGGYAHQVTSFTDETVRALSWSPDGSQLLFLADHHGNEQFQLHLIEPENGWPERLPGEPDVQNHLGSWSPNGEHFAYAANDREPTQQDVLIRTVATGDVQRILAEEGVCFAAHWSPDGRYLTAVRAKSNTNTDVFLIDLTDGSHRLIMDHDDDVQLFAGPWAADGSGFYYASDQDREFTGIGFYTLATDTASWVETPNWDIEQFDVSADGRVMAWIVNEDGYSRTYARDLTSGKIIDLPALPDGVNGGLAISRDGRRLALLQISPRRPGEIHVIDLAAGTAKQITDGFLGGISEEEMVQPELVRITAFDGREIPAFLYKPKGEGPFGVVYSIHGGPEAQERPTYTYNGLYQYWLSRGIGVLATNIRGSTGYGKSYQKLIHRDFGGNDLKDFESAANYLRSLPWVDSAKIGLFGGSYGGFAVLSCMSRLPEYWAAGVDIVGPSNLVTFAKAVPPTWRDFMANWVGDPYTEEEFLMSRSPITYVDQITAPLFVIQGANDPRVVKPESDQIVERLRARGVDVRYDVYEDEGHGFTKRTNSIKAMKDSAEFLEQHLSR